VVNLEIRNNTSYIYFESFMGAKGLPVGTSGKGLLMLSGGIDSPVAGYLAMKRGVSLEAIYFESPPHTSLEAKNKVLELKKIISKYGNEIKINIINLTEIQEAIYKNIPHEYLITILRRMMYRIASIVAKEKKCQIIVNGESIGQVASQTLTSMRVVEEVSDLPIIRPLACFDKSEIIDLAKEIGTYETSILPFEDCCTIFVPEHPVINPTLKKCLEYEALIDYESMIKECLEKKEVISQNIRQFDDIL
ncbi:MAG: tRNA 4-thiouridine(8) synthase ThiI, partial [Mollicutes bacterium]|nr:tRNA 4-thiouridine(8) synthase ThiI [Mollicutes bacterium]